ncbi:MAG: hypothetical protein WC091_05150 [Sulfuricellaceae bacterium]
MAVLNNFVIYFASTRLVRTAAGWIARFSGRMAALQLLRMEQTILRRCTSCAQAVRPSGMPCTRKTAHSSPFNGGFQVEI